MGALQSKAVQLLGIHHLTAVSAKIRENRRFYTETLGMRLVKRSVNQDDVSAYHLFYADAKGSPGTDLGPGFAVDEDPSTLGEHLVLPPFLEHHRAEIAANLEPID